MKKSWHWKVCMSFKWSILTYSPGSCIIGTCRRIIILFDKVWNEIHADSQMFQMSERFFHFLWKKPFSVFSASQIESYLESVVEKKYSHDTRTGWVSFHSFCAVSTKVWTKKIFFFFSILTIFADVLILKMVLVNTRIC